MVAQRFIPQIVRHGGAAVFKGHGYRGSWPMGLAAGLKSDALFYL
jgi:hypothetical protein